MGFDELLKAYLGLPFGFDVYYLPETGEELYAAIGSLGRKRPTVGKVDVT